MATLVPTDRGFSELLQDIVRNLQDLIRSEVRLAKAEVRQEAREAATSVVWLAAGGVGALSAWMLVLWAAVYGLADVMPLWAAALLIGLVLGGIAAMLVTAGWRRLARVRPVPERTVASVKEDLEWLKQSTK